MKKYLIIGIAALAALASCTKVGIDESQIPDKKISFEVASYVPQTRANSSLDSEGYNSFTTNAWFFAAAGKGTDMQYMNGVTVSKGTDSWAPADDYYWPKSGYINFYSYAGTRTPAVSASADFKTVTMAYTNQEIAATDNILVAKPALHYTANTNEVSYDKALGEFNYETGYAYDSATDGGYSGVPTIFQHMLAKVAFIVKLKTTDAKKSANTTWTVEVLNDGTNNSNIIPVKKGTLSLSNTEAATAAAIGEWTNTNTAEPAIGWVAGSDTETIAFAGKTLTIQPNATESAETDNKLVEVRTVMPQLTSGVDFNLSYKVTASHGATNFMEEIINVTSSNLAAAVSSITKWEMNKVYIYTITIDPVTQKVTFDPAVVEWEAATNGAINIDENGAIVTP